MVNYIRGSYSEKQINNSFHGELEIRVPMHEGLPHPVLMEECLGLSSDLPAQEGGEYYTITLKAVGNTSPNLMWRSSATFCQTIQNIVSLINKHNLPY